MQLTKVNPAMNYISFDEPVNLQFAIKMGSSEYVTASGSDITAYLYFVHMERVYDEGIYEYTGQNLYGSVLTTDSPGIGRGASKTITLDTFSMSSIWKNMIISRTGDNGAARIYPMYLGVWAVDNDRETALWVVNYATEPTLIGYFLTSRLDPVISKATITDENPKNLVERFGAFIQRESTVQVAFDVSLDPLDPTLTVQYTFTTHGPGESIVREIGEVGAGTSHVTFTNLQPARTGVFRWTFVVTDSAGRTATKEGSYTVLPYDKPTINSFAVHRYKQTVDDEGHIVYLPSDDGTRIWYSIDATVSSIGGKNAWQLFKRREGSSAKQLLSGTDGTHILTTNDTTLDTDDYPTTENIGLYLELYDSVSSVDRYIVVPKAGAYFDVEKNGVAIGQRTTGAPEKKKFEVAENYETHLYGGLSGVGENHEASSLWALGVQFGYVPGSTSAIAGGKYQDYNVTFPHPYPEGITPLVSVSFDTSSVAGAFGRCCCSATGVNNIGFTLRFFNGDSTGRHPNFVWIALNPGPS